MAHARQQAGAAPPPAAAAGPAAARAEPEGCTEAEEAAARAKIMQFARLRALGQQELPAAAAAPDAGGGNSLLAALHLERLQRQQRQGGGASAPGAAAAPASAPAQARPSPSAPAPFSAGPARLSLLTWWGGWRLLSGGSATAYAPSLRHRP